MLNPLSDKHAVSSGALNDPAYPVAQDYILCVRAALNNLMPVFLRTQMQRPLMVLANYHELNREAKTCDNQDYLKLLVYDQMEQLNLLANIYELLDTSDRYEPRQVQIGSFVWATCIAALGYDLPFDPGDEKTQVLLDTNWAGALIDRYCRDYKLLAYRMPTLSTELIEKDHLQLTFGASDMPAETQWQSPLELLEARSQAPEIYYGLTLAYASVMALFFPIWVSAPSEGELWLRLRLTVANSE